jgi:hypothetical protein
MMHASKAKGVYGPASPTFLTRDEQTTTMTLWCITRAPLMFGGRLPLDANDKWTLPLISASPATLDALVVLMRSHVGVLTRSCIFQPTPRCCTFTTPAPTRGR